MSAFTHRNLNDLDDVAPRFGLGDNWESRPGRGDLDCADTGLMYTQLKPGKRSPFAHKHDQAEEIYLIVAGAGRMKLDDEIIEVRPMDAIRVAPSTVRAFEAGDDGLTWVAIGPHHEKDGEMVEGDVWASA